MRQSVVPGRQSQVANPSSSAALAKLVEKKKEYNAVSALERASALYLERIEALGEDCNIMANAGEVHGQVLVQWPKMFQILSQFLTTRDPQAETDSTRQSISSIAEGQRLVRIPIDELREAHSDKS